MKNRKAQLLLLILLINTVLYPSDIPQSSKSFFVPTLATVALGSTALGIWGATLKQKRLKGHPKPHTPSKDELGKPPKIPGTWFWGSAEGDLIDNSLAFKLPFYFGSLMAFSGMFLCIRNVNYKTDGRDAWLILAGLGVSLFSLESGVFAKERSHQFTYEYIKAHTPNFKRQCTLNGYSSTYLSRLIDHAEKQNKREFKPKLTGKNSDIEYLFNDRNLLCHLADSHGGDVDE